MILQVLFHFVSEFSRICAAIHEPMWLLPPHRLAVLATSPARGGSYYAVIL